MPPDPAPQPPREKDVTDAEAALAVRLAELERRRAERQAERERRRAERDARRAAQRGEQEAAGGEQGGAPLGGDWKTGKPSATWLCSAKERGIELHVTKERPLNQWLTIVPTVLAGFATRPDLGRYLEDTKQVIGRDRKQQPRRIGLVELSLPSDVMQIDLEEPRGVRIAVGRLDARCLVGFKYASGLFPFSILRAPVRLVDSQNNAVSALVDVTFFKDAWLELRSTDGTDLPFKRARLKNGGAIQRNIQDHYEAARLAKGIAEIFGIDLRPKRNKTGAEGATKSIAGDKKEKAAKRATEKP